MLLLVFLSAFLLAACVATREERCNNLADYIDHGNVQVTAAQYLLKGSIIDHKREGLNELCQPALATPIPVDVCRGILEITTSPSSSVIAEIWLPDESEGHLLSVGNAKFDGCIDYPQMIRGISLGFATVGSNAGSNGTLTDALLNQPGILADFSWQAAQQATTAGQALVKQYYDHKDAKSHHVRRGMGGSHELFDRRLAGIPAVSHGIGLSQYDLDPPPFWERYNHPCCWIMVGVMIFCIWVLGLWCCGVFCKRGQYERYRRFQAAQERKKAMEEILFRQLYQQE